MVNNKYVYAIIEINNTGVAISNKLVSKFPTTNYILRMENPKIIKYILDHNENLIKIKEYIITKQIKYFISEFNIDNNLRIWLDKIFEKDSLYNAIVNNKKFNCFSDNDDILYEVVLRQTEKKTDGIITSFLIEGITEYKKKKQIIANKESLTYKIYLI